MTLNHKELLESLRKKKALSMPEICGTYISHSSYSRFIKKGQTLGIDKLLYILRQMDLSFREVGLFDHNIQTSNEDRVLMAEIATQNDLQLIKETAELFASKAKRPYDTYGMLAIQLRLKLGGEAAAQQEQALKDYLFSVQNWDFKEMYLFTFIMDRMDSALIVHHVNRAYQRASEPYYLELNLNLIILIEEAHFEFLKRKDTNHAQNMLDRLEALAVNSTYQSVQGHVTISRSLHNVLKENRPEDYQKIERLYHNFTWVEANYFSNRLQKRYQELQSIYQLPDLAW